MFIINLFGYQKSQVLQMNSSFHKQKSLADHQLLHYTDLDRCPTVDKIVKQIYFVNKHNEPSLAQ